jgi:hypothetical protein
MSVPAFMDELATSSPTTTLAKGIARPNRQSSRVRATKSRDARGAVGCDVSLSRATARAGATNTSDTAENNDALTMR